MSLCPTPDGPELRLRIPGNLLPALWLMLSPLWAANPANLVKVENALLGTTTWQLTSPATNREIEGYASSPSVNIGGQIRLYVSTAAPTYTIQIYRMGWYASLGGRQVFGPVTQNGILQPLPAPDPTIRLIECRWTNPYVLTVPVTWVSGYFLVKLTASTGQQSYIPFVVRDDLRTSDVLMQSSVTTHQAYNNWPGGLQGYSLYDHNSAYGQRATKISFNRPYGLGLNQDSKWGVGAGEFLTNLQPVNETSPAGWEYNMVRWLERSFYDVTYTTDVDTHADGTRLWNHRAFLSVGHDEYWSYEMRKNVTAARDRGIHLGFFGANASYWQIRFETSAADGAANRTMVCYKGSGDPYQDAALYNTYYPYITWQFRSCGGTLCQGPEENLIGVMYKEDPVNADIVVKNTTHWIYFGTGLKDGDRLKGLLGYEVDSIFGWSSPAGLVELARSPTPKGNFSSMTLYTAASGAIVFATGSIQWSWALDEYGVPTLRPSVATPAAAKITRNLLDRFVQ